jgi:hypothetical protein
MSRQLRRLQAESGRSLALQRGRVALSSAALARPFTGAHPAGRQVNNYVLPICSAFCACHASLIHCIFRDHSLAKIQDIEELAQLGKDLNACPYYGTRKVGVLLLSIYKGGLPLIR